MPWCRAGVVLASLSTAVLFAQGPLDYPQWRGHDRDGAASNFVEPAAWPETLTRRWKIAVGEGYGTPVVVGDTVYAFTRADGLEVLTAIDTTSGAERWRTKYAALYTPSQPAAGHGAWPKATPLFYDGRLFTLGISGIVSAFDARSGKLLWQRPPPAEAPFFGAASSPLGEQGLVIVHPGNYGPLTALDAATGAIKWTAGSGGFFASPIPATLGGMRQVVTATEDSVIGVSLDGAVLWRHPWAGGGGSTTPLQTGDAIVVGAPESVAAFRPTLHDGKWSVEPLWTTKDVAMYLSNPVVIADVLFGLSTRSRGQLFALDAKTGAVLWLGQPREADNTAVVKSGNLLFFLNNDGQLTVAQASRGGFEPLKRYVVADSATWAQPAITGNRIFVKDVMSLALWTID